MNPDNRRGFLRGLVTVPLIGGGVTLIGRAAAAAVPLVDVAAAPILGDPRERARYAWAAFSTAMAEVVAGQSFSHWQTGSPLGPAHGWYVSGNEAPPLRQLPGGPWLKARSVHYLAGTEPRCTGLIVDQHGDVGLDF